MMTSFNRRTARRLLLTLSIALAAIVDAGSNCSASPRMPWVPVPEIVPITYYEQFDGLYSWGMTNATVVSGGLTFVQSWSGLALDRSGSSVVPFVVDGSDASGHTNITSHGALRFWVAPRWNSSSSLSGGTGPGAYARLADLNAVSGGGVLVAWSLQVSADGSTLSLIGQSDTGPALLLQTSIAWVAGTAHCVILNFGTNTELYLDGQLVAQGSAAPAVPASLAELSLGSTLAGGEPAQAAFDELTIFSGRLRPQDVDFYYAAMKDEAALGPVSAEEDAARAARLAARGTSRSSAFALSAFGSSVSSMSSLSGCDPSGPLLMTNVSCSFVDTNQGWVCSFDVTGGGSSDTIWEVWGTTNLASGSWGWLTNTYTCSTVTLPNQSPNQTFYILISADSLSHDGHGTPDAWYWLHGLNPFSPGIGALDSNNDGIPNWQEYLRGSDPVASASWNIWIGTPAGLSNLP
jgi:hypothetical protein